MVTRAWLIALLALTLACEGSIETPDGIDRQGAPNVGTDADAGTDTGTDPGTDAGTVPDAGTDPGTGGNPGQCAGGPLAAPVPNCNPDPAPNSGDIHADCVARINQLRWECQCLPPLQRWNAAEGCANQHSEYDSTRSAHAGFSGKICAPGGWAQNECPGWNSTEHVINGCLQAMWDEGPGEPYSAHGHYINMTNPSYTMVACGFFETPGGSVWSVQNFQ